MTLFYRVWEGGEKRNFVEENTEKYHIQMIKVNINNEASFGANRQVGKQSNELET